MKKLQIALTASMLSVALLMTACGGNAPATDGAGGDKQVADAFPTKAIEIVIPYSPGGNTDLATRLVAQNMTKHLPEGNKGAIVVNKAGGGGVLAMSDIVGRPADGYTLGVMSNGVVASMPLQQEVSYDFDNIDFLMHFYTIPSMVNVLPSSPYQTSQQLLDYVKNNPGKLRLGLLAVGNSQHIAWLKLCKELNSSVTVIPFKGTTDALTSLQQGMIDATMAYPIGDQKDGLVQLFHFSSAKSKYFPNADIVGDLGYPAATTDMFFYFVAAKGIPDARRQVLVDSITKTLEDPAVIEGFKNLEIDAYYESGEWVKETLQAERDSSKPFLEELGLLKEQQAGK